MGWWPENSSLLLKLSQQAFHFGSGMLIALPISRRNAPAQKTFRVFRSVVLRQGLRIHLITRNVIRIYVQQGFEMCLGSWNVALTQTLEGDAIA